MFITILAGGFWTVLCSWIFWMALLAVGSFILGWLFRTPKIDEWKHKYENEVSSNSSFSKKYSKLEKASAGFNKEKSQMEHTIERQKSEITNLKNKSVKLENDYRASSRENESLTGKLGLMNSEISALRSTDEPVLTTDENEKEVDRLTEILHRRDSEIERLRNTVSETKAEKDEYIRRSESYKPRFEDANLERNTLRVKYDKLVAQTANMSLGETNLSDENTKLKAELAAMKSEMENQASSGASRQEEVDGLIKVAKKAEAEKNDLQIKYESLLRHTEQMKASNTNISSTPITPIAGFTAPVTPPPTPVTPPTPTPTPTPVAGAEDDLKKIEGIGPKIEELIKNGGIKTWSALSQTDPSVIQQFLNEAGPRYKMHNPGSWPLQAGMCARGEWEALEKWQDEHDGGLL